MKKYIESLVKLVVEHHGDQINKILLKGSQLNRGQTDYWSDIDIVIVMAKSNQVHHDIIEVLKPILGELIAEEIHQGPAYLVSRMVLLKENNINLFDLSIIEYDHWEKEEASSHSKYKLLFGSSDPKIKVKPPTKVFEFEYPLESINQTWFLFFICVKKFMRNDNLIGMHLLSHLFQEILVLEMKERDIRLQTDIHRFGFNEILPISIPSNLDCKSKEKTLEYLLLLAKHFDDKLAKHLTAYTNKFKVFKGYVNESKKRI